jgi:tRNA(Met) cytidine acetyltransferase
MADLHRALHLIWAAPEDPLTALAAAAAGLPPDQQATLRGGEAKAARRLLGRSLSLVVVDLRARLEVELLGVGEGLVRGGGALVVILSESPTPDPSLEVPPFGPARTALHARLRAALRPVATPLPAVLRVAPAPAGGGPEQAAAVEALTAAALQPGARVVLVADRGRGKSAALGLAVAAARAARPGLRVGLTGPSPAAVAEVHRFGGPGLQFIPPGEQIDAPYVDLLLVDEAAQLGLPLLAALAAAHPQAAQLWSSTAHGYEGSGQGFLRRFVPALDAAAAARGAPPPLRLRLRAPVRWAAGCPTEAAVRAALCLDAAPCADGVAAAPGAPRIRLVPPAELAADSRLLHEVMGLLREAHHRTTPADLARLLDAPNLELWVAQREDSVLAVNLLALEGELPPPLAAAAAAGRGRLRGQALVDNLLCHLGAPVAVGGWPFVRSLRLAVHPAARRRGLAAALVEATHAAHPNRVFGTLFSASPELLRLRARWGYHLVRVGATPSAQAGAPSALMLRPARDAASVPGGPSAEAVRGLVDGLARRLARDLPVLLPLARAECGAPFDPDLDAALRAALPPATPLGADERDQLLDVVLDGPAPMDSAAAAVVACLPFAPMGPEAPRGARALRLRFAECWSWAQIHDLMGGSLPALQREAKAALRAARAAAQAAGC